MQDIRDGQCSHKAMNTDDNSDHTHIIATSVRMCEDHIVTFLAIQCDKQSSLLAALSTLHHPRVFKISICPVPSCFSACFTACQQSTARAAALVLRLYLRTLTKQSYQDFLCGVPSHCDNLDEHSEDSQLGEGRYHLY